MGENIKQIPFNVDPGYTGIAIAYRNNNLIADKVMPRIPVNSPKFTYTEWGKGEHLTVPDTRVGRTSAPNRVDFSAAEKTDKVENFALDSPVPNEDIDAAKSNPNGYDPMKRAVVGTTDLIELGREVRVSGLTFDPNQYDADHKIALSGAQQWSDASSKPLDDLLNAIDAMLFRPNALVLGQSAWRHLRTNPQIVKSINKNDGGDGVVTKQAVAELLEIGEIIVGSSFVNIAKQGQTPSIVRCWGGHAALIYNDILADMAGSRMTWAATAQWGTRISGTVFDPNMGGDGGYLVRVMEKVKEKILARDLGYLFQNVVPA